MLLSMQALPPRSGCRTLEWVRGPSHPVFFANHDWKSIFLTPRHTHFLTGGARSLPAALWDLQKGRGHRAYPGE